MAATWSVLTVVAMFFICGVSASFPNYLCPTTENRKTFRSCEFDCQRTHGAAYGYCGDARIGDYNCYCGPARDFIYPQSAHCKSPNSNWQRLCEVDCQCNHAGTGGKCFFDKKICGCYGMEQYNSRCPMATVEDFANFAASIAGDDAGSWKPRDNTPKVPDEEPY